MISWFPFLYLSFFPSLFPPFLLCLFVCFYALLLSYITRFSSLKPPFLHFFTTASSLFSFLISSFLFLQPPLIPFLPFHFFLFSFFILFFSLLLLHLHYKPQWLAAKLPSLIGPHQGECRQYPVMCLIDRLSERIDSTNHCSRYFWTLCVYSIKLWCHFRSSLCQLLAAAMTLPSTRVNINFNVLTAV